MAFVDRIKTAGAFENSVEAFCREKFISVAKNGTEHTHPQFVVDLRRRNDRGSKLVRFAPDGVALQTCGVWHWEAKAGKHIEKDAYETYMAYRGMGARLLVFLRHPDGTVYYQEVQRIGFVPSINVVGKFPVDRRHPIDEDDWICPRMGHGYAGSGSGTAYKEVDFSSLTLIADFASVCDSKTHEVA